AGKLAAVAAPGSRLSLEALQRVRAHLQGEERTGVCCSSPWVDFIGGRVDAGRVPADVRGGRLRTRLVKLERTIERLGVYPVPGMRRCRSCERWVPAVRGLYYSDMRLCDDCATMDGEADRHRLRELDL